MSFLDDTNVSMQSI